MKCRAATLLPCLIGWKQWMAPELAPSPHQARQAHARVSALPWLQHQQVRLVCHARVVLLQPVRTDAARLQCIQRIVANEQTDATTCCSQTAGMVRIAATSWGAEAVFSQVVQACLLDASASQCAALERTIQALLSEPGLQSISTSVVLEHASSLISAVSLSIRAVYFGCDQAQTVDTTTFERTDAPQPTPRDAQHVCMLIRILDRLSRLPEALSWPPSESSTRSAQIALLHSMMPVAVLICANTSHPLLDTTAADIGLAFVSRCASQTGLSMSCCLSRAANDVRLLISHFSQWPTRSVHPTNSIGHGLCRCC